MKKLVILGGGESGVGAAVLGLKKGYDVFLSDFSEIKPKFKTVLENLKLDFEEQVHTEAKIFQVLVLF